MQERRKSSSSGKGEREKGEREDDDLMSCTTLLTIKYCC